MAPVHLSLIGIYNFINVKFDSDLEREEREIPTRSRPIIVVIVGRETTIYTWEKEKEQETNGMDGMGGGEERKRSWKGWTHWPGIKVPVPPSDALDHLGVDRGVGSRRP